MNSGRWNVGLLTGAAGILLVAGIVHLTSIFLMPAFAVADGYARMSRLGGQGKFTVLPAPRPGEQAFPFEDAATQIAICMFDLDRGPLRVRAAVDDEDMLALSFHARDGVVFHAVTERAALKGRLSIVLADARQLDAIEAGDVDDAVPQDVRLLAPTRQGFVMARALPASKLRTAEFQRRIGAMECAVTPK